MKSSSKYEILYLTFPVRKIIHTVNCCLILRFNLRVLSILLQKRTDRLHRRLVNNRNTGTECTPSSSSRSNVQAESHSVPYNRFQKVTDTTGQHSLI